MTPDLYDSLDGQVALVTGATRGIGEAIAGELAALGATVYAGARNPHDVTAPDQRPVQLDVTNEGEIETAIERIADEAGRLDILVNNAGVAPPYVPLDEAAVEDIDTTLDVNLRGPILVTRSALSLLLEREGGRVVNVSSGDGVFEDVHEGYDGIFGGNYPSYRISKAGLNGLTAYLHGEYANEGLLANAVCPGSVRTDMGADDAPRSPSEGAETPVWLARFKSGSLCGRMWRDNKPIPW